tara:strand:+ start:711 stop:1514 length:804 start_codon:yes stop_codon:yes gene_type:complete
MVTFLTPEQIQDRAPAVFATGHDGKRSDRYTFVSSEKIINNFKDLGWGVTHAASPYSRKSDPLHTKHMLRFRPEKDRLSFQDPRSTGTDGTIFPEILLYNSSNGTSSWKMSAGAFSMVCSNGLTIRVPGFEKVGEEISRKHLDWDPVYAYDAVERMTSSFGGFFSTVAGMVRINLDDNQRIEMASEAASLRFENAHVDPMLLLQPRRKEDQGRDIWTTYNVLQENCVRPSFRLNKRPARTLRSIDALDRVNSGLWSLAEDTLIELAS